MAMYKGFGPPFWGDSIFPAQEDERLISNDILQLLLVVPGEIEHKPGLGVGLRTLLFESYQSNDLDIIANEIADTIAAEDPRIIDPKVVITDSGNYITIIITGRMALDMSREIRIERTFDVS